MPSGLCPECKNLVALSAYKCEKCGNRDFDVITGETYKMVNTDGSCYTTPVIVDCRQGNYKELAKRIAIAKNAEYGVELEKNKKWREKEQIRQQEAEERRRKEEKKHKQELNEAKDRERRNANSSTLVSGIFLSVIIYFVAGLGGCFYRMTQPVPSNSGSINVLTGQPTKADNHIYNTYNYRAYKEEAVYAAVGVLVVYVFLIFPIIRSRK